MDWTPETEAVIDEVYREGLAEIAKKQGVTELEVAKAIAEKGPRQIKKRGRITQARQYLIRKLHMELCHLKRPEKQGVLQVERTTADYKCFSEVVLPGDAYQLLGSLHIAKKLGINRATVTLSIQAQIAERTPCERCGKMPAEPISRVARKAAEAQGHTDIWFNVEGIATPYMMDDPFCAECHDSMSWESGEKPASADVVVETVGEGEDTVKTENAETPTDTAIQETT
jgi:hypothetical protein